jgi:hypothetical protein
LNAAKAEQNTGEKNDEDQSVAGESFAFSHRPQRVCTRVFDLSSLAGSLLLGAASLSILHLCLLETITDLWSG